MREARIQRIRVVRLCTVDNIGNVALVLRPAVPIQIASEVESKCCFNLQSTRLKPILKR